MTPPRRIQIYDESDNLAPSEVLSPVAEAEPEEEEEKENDPYRTPKRKGIKRVINYNYRKTRKDKLIRRMR